MDQFTVDPLEFIRLDLSLSSALSAEITTSRRCPLDARRQWWSFAVWYNASLVVMNGEEGGEALKAKGNAVY